MNESTMDLRFAKVLNNEDDKKDNNRIVAIKVIGTAPILAGTYIERITGNSGSDYGTIDTKDTTTPKLDKQHTNFLYDDTEDEDGNIKYPDRYKYLGIAQSIITKLFVTIYYDNLFKDILIIPDMDSLGTDDAGIDFYANNTMTLQAYTVGRGDFKEKPFKEIVNPLIDNDVDGIPEPDKFDKTTTILASTHGLAINSTCSGRTLILNKGDDNETRIGNTKASPLQYIQFPDNDDIFEDGTLVATNNMIQQFHDELSIDFVGKKLINKIVIPINF